MAERNLEPTNVVTVTIKTQIVTRDEHIRIGHLGVSVTIAAVRSNFSIVNIYSIASRLRKNGVECKGKLLTRLNQPCVPFTNSGVD